MEVSRVAVPPSPSAQHLQNVITALRLWEEVEQAAHSLLARRRSGLAVGPAYVGNGEGYAEPRPGESDDL